MDCIDDNNLDIDLDVAEAGLYNPIAWQPAVHLSTTRLILLSMGFVGFRACTDVRDKAFLRSLHLNDSVIALIWLGGPVCGAVLQPYFGLCSEHCRSSWGRRRPYIAGGAAAVVISLLGLAYADAVASRSPTTTTGAQVMAIFAMTILNAAIQPLQGGLRALLVDISPPHQLATANAWASRLTSMANVLDYLAGFLDLSGPSSPLGDSQFRVHCQFSAAVLVASVTLTYQRQSRKPDTNKFSNRYLVEEGTRMGSLGLLLFSVTALVTGSILPMVLLREQESHKACSGLRREEDEEQPLQKSMRDPDARIQRIWMWALVLYVTCILSNIIVTSLWGTYALVGFCGISWAVTIWAPFSLISMAIRDNDTEEEEEEAGKEDSADSLHVCVENKPIERRPGIAMALHNTANSAPQIVAVVISSIVFRVCSDNDHFDGKDGGIAWSLRITAFSAVVAAMIAKKGSQ
ncbi:sucrose transport protein [Grosmannia clavigera kw1407]|uniref:Sucrose transport protein n=1 Tax=Grosmannia clavigera (strain kw1407 / UAMH 11150) TaxID=655863 RepID=F0XF68_GROCL|nr:sucrose transport protein [Grosmannia clavigera kw1407]EFX03828.1 sucrose transport protein [Grosmannia clavigera kw1407]